MMVEYSLAGYTNPIGGGNWERQITQSLPTNELNGILPRLKRFEAELRGENDDNRKDISRRRWVLSCEFDNYQIINCCAVPDPAHLQLHTARG